MAPSRLATFNNPVEAGLRILALLVEAYPRPIELQKLVFLDFLTVHSADAGGPKSLHPPTPHRGAELVVRRDLLNKGGLLLVSRGLLARHFDGDGFSFVATEHSGSFLASLTSGYTLELRDRATWVISTYGERTVADLSSYFSDNLTRWGGEFAISSLGDISP